MNQNAYLTVKHKIFQASLTLIMRRKTYWYLMIHLILVSCYARKRTIDIERLLKGDGYDDKKQLAVKFYASEINKSIFYQGGSSSSIIRESFSGYIEGL